VGSRTRCFPIWRTHNFFSDRRRAQGLRSDYYLREQQISDAAHKSVDGTHPSGGVGASRVALTLQGSKRGSERGESARRMIPVDRPAGACYSFARHFHSGAAALPLSLVAFAFAVFVYECHPPTLCIAAYIWVSESLNCRLMSEILIAALERCV
jgi:hypothetical protein